MPQAPINDTVTIHQLIDDPYPIYRRFRQETPVVHVNAVGRTMLTKAAFNRAVKDNPDLFSSDDPGTPQTLAFRTRTMMRKDGEAHMCERMAMASALSPKNLRQIWAPQYEALAEKYLDALPRGEVVDLFSLLAGPISGRKVANLCGLTQVSDEDMQRWCQTLIDAAGNFGWFQELFDKADKVNDEVDAAVKESTIRLQGTDDQSALATMINTENPIPLSQIQANLKLAISGGVNESRDSMLTTIFGLLTNPDQLEEVKRTNAWGGAFEEAVRWVAPIQVSSRRVTEDTEIGGIDIQKDEVVMTVQASSNHDEELFDKPEKFNAFRRPNPHQSFGSGPHHCFGTHLARMTVGKTMLPLIFERFPNMQLVDADAVKWSGFGFRGPLSMPVRLQ